MIDNLTENLGDLPIDVLGSQQKFLKIGNEETISHEASNLDSILNEWAERRDGQTSLVPNTEYRTAAGKDTVPVNKEATLRSARLMIMQNEPLQKIENCLTLGKSALTAEEKEAVLSERAFLGHIYLDRSAAEKCQDIREAAKHPVARHALYLVASSDCKLCNTHYNGICPVSGLKLIAKVPSTESELAETVKLLMASGRIPSSAKITTWDDLRSVLTPIQAEMKPRMYPHASPVTAVKPDMEKQAGMIRKASDNRKATETTINDMVDSKAVMPIARFIGESLMKGLDLSIVKAEVANRYPNKSQVNAAFDFLRKRASPELLLTHMAAFPSFYEGACEKCRDFLRDNGIKVASIYPIAQCKDCKWRKNVAGSCSLIGAKILEAGISAQEIDTAIDELQVKGRLSYGQAQDLKKTANLKTRLTETVRLAYMGEKPVAATSKAPNSLLLSVEKFASKENTILWAIDALSKKASVSQIKAELAKQRSDAEGILQNALASVGAVHADSLDSCMTEKYVFFANSPTLIKSAKCEKCENCDGLQCKKQCLAFSQRTLTASTQSPEGDEISSYFADSALTVDINSKSAKKPLDIHMSNEGAGMVVDVAQNKASSEDFQALYGTPELIVDTEPRTGGAQPLDVAGLGSGEGFDISSIF